MSNDERETKLSPEDQAYWENYMNLEELEDEIEDFAQLLDEYKKNDEKPTDFLVKTPKKAKKQTGTVSGDTKLDRKTEESLRKGKLSIERIYDLHGLRQQEAYAALEKFILRSYQAKCRCVLVITGKGKEGSQDHWTDEPKGVLKRKVPEWLSGNKFNPYILKVITAHPKHGGEGAYYIYLKRNY